MTAQHPQVIYETWIDEQRNREIPVKIYLPTLTTSHIKPPVVLVSHGIGGSCESYKYIGEFLARHGFVSIHPTHVGIDASLMKTERPFKALKDAAHDSQYLHVLPQDMHFLLDYLEKKKSKDFDLSRIAMAGHSYGSYVTLALSGQDISRDGTPIDYKDCRIKAAVAISPLATRNKSEESYDEIEIPILHITGKKDDSPFGTLDPIERRVPYDNINHTDQYLIIFEHADHFIFAAQRRQNKFSAEDVIIMELTAAAILEFLKKYITNEETAIDTAEFAARLDGHATFEKKLK